MRLVSYARTLDAKGRAAKLSRALAAAVAGGATHIVVSGDLTEIGSDAQFDAFAGALHDSGIAPDRVTLVPGNHDAYTREDGWRRALEGPLRAFKASSAHAPAPLVDRGEVIFVPIDSSCFQSIARSGGRVTDEAASAIASYLADPAMRDKAIVLVQHHPPYAHPHKTMAWNWIDGLKGAERLVEAMMKRANVQLLHGHLHRESDGKLGASRVFGAPAVVDDGEAPRVRFYDVKDGALERTPGDPIAA